VHSTGSICDKNFETGLQSLQKVALNRKSTYLISFSIFFQKNQ
jgi:hypothetical protein